MIAKVGIRSALRFDPLADPPEYPHYFMMMGDVQEGVFRNGMKAVYEGARLKVKIGHGGQHVFAVPAPGFVTFSVVATADFEEIRDKTVTIIFTDESDGGIEYVPPGEGESAANDIPAPERDMPPPGKPDKDER